MNASRGISLILFGVLFLIAAFLLVAWDCSRGLDSVRYASNVLLEHVCPMHRELVFGRGWGWILLSREAMITETGMVLTIWGAMSLAGICRSKPSLPSQSAAAESTSNSDPVNLAPNESAGSAFVPSGNPVGDQEPGFRVSPSAGRIDDFFPSITFYDDRQEYPRLLCEFKGTPERHPPALRFLVAGFAPMREEVESVERACPTLAGRGADFIIEGLRNVVRTRSFWISMLAAMPGRTSVLIDRVQVALPAELAAALPEHIRATFEPLEDGSFLIAEGPL